MNMLFEIRDLKIQFLQNALVYVQCYRPRFDLPTYATALAAAVAAVTNRAAVAVRKAREAR